ncbi:DnaJ -like protein subfamily C member 7 [Halotydeus destructor]|nr:DnaJ -like protein subfamily C member 7 [Halotydeus destructor]
MEAENGDILVDQEPDVIISSPVINQKDGKELAEAKKDEGNKWYKQGKYNEAVRCYSEAIDLAPHVSSFYGNRCACYMMVNKFKLALEDAQKSVKIDNTFVKGYVREAKCHLALGEADQADRSLQAIQGLEPNNSDLVKERGNLDRLRKAVAEVQKHVANKDSRSVVYYSNRVLELAPEYTKFKLVKAEALALQQKYQDAQDIVTDILRVDSMNADALYIRGMVLYYQDNIDKALTHFQQALRFNPDNEKCRTLFKKVKLLKTKKDGGNEAFKANKLQEALALYNESLDVDPLNSATNAKIYLNRAIVHNKLGKQHSALEDCNKAIELDSNYIKAYLKRARLHMDLEMFEESVRDYDLVYKKEKTAENKRFLEHAKLELKKSQRKDYYKILGVERNANDDEIKRAYKKRALVHHPDRHASATDTEKREQEKKFKEIGEAYAILSDSRKRTRYDQGVDIDGSGEYSPGYADIDPTSIFNAFFAGGNGPAGFGGHQFNFGGGGGGQNGGHYSGGNPFNHF